MGAAIQHHGVGTARSLLDGRRARAAAGLLCVLCSSCHLLTPYRQQAADARPEADARPRADAGLDVGPLDGASDVGSQDAGVQWPLRFGAADPGGLAIDDQGHLYLAGGFEGTLDLGGEPLVSAGDSDLFVASFTAEGSHRWSLRFGDQGRDTATAIALSGDDLFVAGVFEDSVTVGPTRLDSAGGADILLAALSTAGDPRWAQGFGDVAADQTPRELAVDSAGNVYMAGNFEGSVDFGTGPLTAPGYTSVFIASFNTGGTPRWANRYGTVRYNNGYGLAVAGGRVYVAGFYEGAATFGGPRLPYEGIQDAFVASYQTSDGAHLWSRGLGGAGFDWAFSVAADELGNVYLTGFFEDTVDLSRESLVSRGERDAFVVSYDADGTLRWAKALGGAGCDMGRGVMVARNVGDVYVTGGFQQTVDFGGGDLMATDALDAFVVGLSSGDGSYLGAWPLGGSGSDGGHAVAVAPGGEVYSVGRLEATPTDCGTKPNGGDLYIARTTPWP